MLPTALALLAALPVLAALARLAGPLLSATALLAATVLLPSAAFISPRLAGFAAVLEVRFGTRVRREPALIAVLTLSLRSSLAAVLGLHRAAVALALLVALTPASALMLIRLRSGPTTHAWLTGRLRSLFGPPRPSRFLASFPVLILLPGSLAPHFAAPARGALEPAAVAVALALVLVALLALLVVPVRSVLP